MSQLSLTLTYTSGNSAIATVSNNGLITAKTGGSTTITVKDTTSNKTQTVTVYSYTKVKSVGTKLTYEGTTNDIDFNYDNPIDTYSNLASKLFTITATPYATTSNSNGTYGAPNYKADIKWSYTTYYIPSGKTTPEEGKLSDILSTYTIDSNKFTFKPQEGANGYFVANASADGKSASRIVYISSTIKGFTVNPTQVTLYTNDTPNTQQINVTANY